MTPGERLIASVEPYKQYGKEMFVKDRFLSAWCKVIYKRSPDYFSLSGRVIGSFKPNDVDRVEGDTIYLRSSPNLD